MGLIVLKPSQVKRNAITPPDIAHWKSRKNWLILII